MARLSVGLAIASVVAVAGCGGGGGDGKPQVRCDDAAFRNQTEELYVAIATAQNAQTPGAPAAVVVDLKRGAEVLRGYLTAHPPCDAKLKELGQAELDAVGKLDSAVSALEAGADAAAALSEAVSALGQAERALR